MESMSVLEVGVTRDELFVVALEPRLEFTAAAGGGCLYFPGDEQCDFCLTPDGDLDFVCDGSDSS
jgi:hypothetical protein